jgi:CRISPR-associated protein Csx10
MSRFVKYLRYTLTLKAPAIVSTLSGDPNSSITQPFISGGAVRGVLAGELLNQGVSADSADFRRLILEGDVRFLHAYPANGSGRSLPAPIPWRKRKGHEQATTFDLSAYTGLIESASFNSGDDGEVEIEPEDVWPTASLVRIGFPFLEFSGSTARGLLIRTDARSHQQRDRVKGRAWKTTREDGSEEAHGALFAYEYLEPGQTFQGWIQVLTETESDPDAIIEKIKNILNQRQIAVGRSRRAGYGGAATISFASTENHEALWGDVQQDDVPAASQFRAYLLSACIARDPFAGQVDPCALLGLLVQRLGGVVNIQRILWDFETVGGFNRKWQLEVPQALAVKAGSMIVLKANQAVSADVLRQIEHEALGERRIEGFGRLAFLKEGTLKIRIEPDDRENEPYPQPNGPAPEVVGFMQRRLLGGAFSRSLDRQVRNLVRDVKHVPTGSLLGRLRIPLRNGDPAVGLRTLQQWLDDQEANRRTALKEEAQRKLRECQLAHGTSLRDWLIQNATAQAGAEAAMKEVAMHRKYQLGAGDGLARSAATSQGAAYAARLIDAVLAALARQARRREREAAS